MGPRHSPTPTYNVVLLTRTQQFLFMTLYTLFSFSVIRQMSQTHSLPHVTISFLDHISVIVDRFVRFLWLCHLEFDKAAIFKE